MTDNFGNNRIAVDTCSNKDNNNWVQKKNVVMIELYWYLDYLEENLP